MYVWSRVSCSRPPTTFTGGEGYMDICISYTHTYTYCLHLHMHILHTYTLLTIYIYTRIFPHTYILHIHTLLHTFEPHSDRSLWIFRCRPKNHFWAKSDGFNDTVLVSNSWSLASFLHHFASFFWSFQMWLAPGKISDCSIFGRSLLFSPDQKNAASGCPGMYTHVYIYI